VFDIESYNGFLSGLETSVTKLHPQLQLVLCCGEYTKGSYTSTHLEFVTPVSEHAQVLKHLSKVDVTLVYPLSDVGEPDAW
jgi:hypothetical protein